MKTIAMTLACLLVAGTAAAAEQTYSVVVKQSDFRSAEAVANLHARIRKQSRQACPNYFVERDLRAMAQCREEVEAELVSKINHPVLNAFVEGEESLRIALAARKGAGDRS